jgi:acyl-CoA synthetase (NDP forming)
MILPEHESNRMLANAGIPVVPMRLADSLDDARADAQAMGFPVVLKFSSQEHTHKTEIGGVIAGIATDHDLENAFKKLDGLRARLDPKGRIIMEPMISGGTEFFIGFQVHPQFGPVISIGLGGVLLELFKDVAFRLLPARRPDFQEMLGELKSWPKLKKGFRNLPPIDERHVIDLLDQVAAFALSRKDLKELDLNPVIFRQDDAVIVDARIVLD